MTNFEKYKDEILKIAEAGSCCIAVKDGKPVKCEGMPRCGDCELNTDGGSGCLFEFLKWAHEDDSEGLDCGKCKHYNEGDTADSCEHCKRYYLDRFERRSLKTRQSEFLKAYPNANVLGIQPCAIEGESFRCRDESEPCSECARAYWKQEVK